MSNHNKETEARCFHCYRHYVEGTAAWALYMMRMGHKVTNPKDDPRVYYLPEGGIIQVDGMEIIAGNKWIDYWCIDIPDGWEIYEEPKPKPLLADAKIGDLCKRRDGRFVSLSNVPPDSLYWEVGNNLYYQDGRESLHEERDVDIVYTEPLAPEGSAEWALQMMKLGKTISRTDNQKEIYVYRDGKIVANEWHRANQQWFLKYAEPTGWQLYEPKPEPEPKPAYSVGDWVRRTHAKRTSYGRVLQVTDMLQLEYTDGDKSWAYKHDCITIPPSEVVIRIGCLSGTVSKYPNNKFLLKSGVFSSLIDINMLDPDTAALVQALLKAQEEK